MSTMGTLKLDLDNCHVEVDMELGACLCMCALKLLLLCGCIQHRLRIGIAVTVVVAVAFVYENSHEPSDYVMRRLYLYLCQIPLVDRSTEYPKVTIILLASTTRSNRTCHTPHVSPIMSLTFPKAISAASVLSVACDAKAYQADKTLS